MASSTRSLLSRPIELCMECVDDELTPWQREANERAEAEYRSAIQRIEAECAVQLATAPPVAAIRNAPVQRANSPDVIILDDVSSAAPTRRSSSLLASATINGDSAIQSPPLASTSNIPNVHRSVGRIPVLRVQGQQRPPNTVSPSVQRKPGKSAESEMIVIDDAASKLKTQTPADREKEDEASWVPLDEYYYGKKEGDPSYVEDKGEHRFKCCVCQKMLYNNLRLMLHLQGHIDSEKQQNLQLSDITQCKHCYRQFDTPFEMQCHIEKVHQNKSNVLVCRICEKDHQNESALRHHMKQSHNACEMPYICQLCDFRSSIYSDVVDHFKKRHDSSGFLLCLYCLRVLKVQFSKTRGWAMTHTYFYHIQKHQVKTCQKKCPQCKLTFLNKADVKTHCKQDHTPNFKGIRGASSSTTVTANKQTVMIQLPDRADAQQKAGTPKSLNAPSMSKVIEMRGLQMTELSDKLLCIECSAPMNSISHYRKYIECSMCRYATICSAAYANHMMGYHSGNDTGARWHQVPQEPPLAQPLYCLCGYTAKFGSSLANHLISCSKTTCYTKKPKPKWIEYDDEREESAPGPSGENVPSLFGALGLVKKKAGASNKRGRKRSASAAVERVAASAVSPSASSSPPRKWLLPKKAGSKVSIMAGAHKNVKIVDDAETSADDKSHGEQIDDDDNKADMSTDGKVSEDNKPAEDDVDSEESAVKSEEITGTIADTDSATVNTPSKSDILAGDLATEMDSDTSNADKKDETMADSVCDSHVPMTDESATQSDNEPTPMDVHTTKTVEETANDLVNTDKAGVAEDNGVSTCGIIADAPTGENTTGSEGAQSDDRQLITPNTEAVQD